VACEGGNPQIAQIAQILCEALQLEYAKAIFFSTL